MRPVLPSTTLGNAEQVHKSPDWRGHYIPLLGELQCCVDGVAQCAHNAAAGTALQQGPDHVLLAQLACKVQSCQPFMVQVVQATGWGSAQELEGGNNK